MKKSFLALMLFAAGAFGANVPISTDVDPRDRNTAQAAAELVREVGYRCDSIDFFMRDPWDGNFNLTCNGNRYSYVLKDVGGRIMVEVR